MVVTYEWGLLPHLTDAGMEREELFTEPVYLALPARHHLAGTGPVGLADLVDEEWIVGRDSTSMLDLVVAATRRQGYEPQTDFHSMDFQVILAAVGQGLGVGLSRRSPSSAPTRTWRSPASPTSNSTARSGRTSAAAAATTRA